MIEKIPFLRPILPQLELLHSKVFPAWYVRSYAKAFVQFDQEVLLLPFLVPSGSTAVDVGAHIGAYVWHLLRLTNSVEAFEPNPDLIRFLGRAFKEKIKLHDVALSDQDGQAALEIPLDGITGSLKPQEAHLTTVPSTNSAAAGTFFIVNSKKLDDFNLKNIGFMKIDVEGHELNVLRGCSEILRVQKPNLLIEAEERHKADAVPLLQTHLSKYGYRGYFLRHGQLCPISMFRPDMQDVRNLVSVNSGAARDYINNFVFVHSDRSDDFEAAFHDNIAIQSPPLS